MKTRNFFFSSRRRHTRSLRDWSSDVCSSDLGAAQRGEWNLCPPPPISKPSARASGRRWSRSEERRVGKECRFRWWWYYCKKNRLGGSTAAVTSPCCGVVRLFELGHGSL